MKNFSPSSIKHVLKALPLLLLAGCMETAPRADQNEAGAVQPAAARQEVAAPAAAAPAGGRQEMMQMSTEQLAKLDVALAVKTKNRKLRAAIDGAAPVIRDFVKTNACITGYDGSALNAYAAPGKNYPTHNYIGAPMQTMKRHDKSSCVSVLRLQGWSMPAKNALRFQIVYHAADSGESVKQNHELIKQPGGEWLFSR